MNFQKRLLDLKTPNNISYYTIAEVAQSSGGLGVRFCLTNTRGHFACFFAPENFKVLYMSLFTGSSRIKLTLWGVKAFMKCKFTVLHINQKPLHS